MYERERRQYEMLVRVRDFGDRYGHLFPASSVAQRNFAAVARAVRELESQDVEHMGASASARAQRKIMAGEALHARLQAINQTARVLAAERPGLDQQFEMPNPPTDQALLTAARKFARDAEPLNSQFLAHGMPATFVAELLALVDIFERALRDRGAGREAHAAVRTSTRAALSSGLSAVRLLDAIVTNHLRDDAVTTAVWERDRRVVYRASAPRTDATPEPAPAAAAPDPPTDDKAA